MVSSIIILSISLIFVGVGKLTGTILLNKWEANYDKVSGYECGFDAFSDARDPFDVKFYLIGILFIIFDVELFFFFPFIMSIKEINLYGFYFFIYFLIVLVIGFLYEWKKGCMNWD